MTRLIMDAELPFSADDASVAELVRAAYFNQGITITTPTGYKVDVILDRVEVIAREGADTHEEVQGL